MSNASTNMLVAANRLIVQGGVGKPGTAGNSGGTIKGASSANLG